MVTRIDLEAIAPAQRGDVERRLAVRYRADDGAFHGQTLRDLIESGSFVAKTHLGGPRVTYGLLMTWPGLEGAQFFRVTKSLWTAVDLAVTEWQPPE